MIVNFITHFNVKIPMRCQFTSWLLILERIIILSVTVLKLHVTKTPSFLITVINKQSTRRVKVMSRHHIYGTIYLNIIHSYYNTRAFYKNTLLSLTTLSLSLTVFFIRKWASRAGSRRYLKPFIIILVIQFLCHHLCEIKGALSDLFISYLSAIYWIFYYQVVFYRQKE